MPMIAALREALGPSPLISVDTFYGSVASGAVEAGADIVNDVTGGEGDPEGMPVFLGARYREGGVLYCIG